ncbi:MAG TPA: (d)CMP kinase [Polyangiales bacterium]|jgi:cytidylate kinase|nr:(d)CMP kinase [Polyangiales bacterium]
MTRPRPVIAIDGPAGAGKSTVAQQLAKRLGFVLVDTGALYRGLALIARERGVPWTDGPALGELASKLDLRFESVPDAAPRLLAADRDLSSDIRTPEISMGASDVSKHPEVRDALLELQRQLGREGGVVLEGRDIGTVVFPDAEAKVFLTASADVRAQRRVHDLQSRGIPADFGQTLAEIQARDAQDSGRSVAPLKAAPDAIVLDTTNLDIAAVVDELARLALGKRA